jgi:hypothetical protein
MPPLPPRLPPLLLDGVEGASMSENTARPPPPPLLLRKWSVTGVASAIGSLQDLPSLLTCIVIVDGATARGTPALSLAWMPGEGDEEEELSPSLKKPTSMRCRWTGRWILKTMFTGVPATHDGPAAADA